MKLTLTKTAEQRYRWISTKIKALEIYKEKIESRIIGALSEQNKKRETTFKNWLKLEIKFADRQIDDLKSEESIISRS